MTRRTLIKLMALFPLAGPTIVKALAKPELNLRLGYGLYLPAEFPKWNKAVDGLEEAGKWAIDIERSRLPSNLVVPRAGQVWETLRACEVSFRPCFACAGRALRAAGGQFAAMLGGTAQIPQGERVRILSTDNPRPIYVTFSPVRHQELEESIVSADIPKLPGYHGYQLQVKTAKTISDFDKKNCQTFFNEAFRFVEDPSHYP